MKWYALTIRSAQLVRDRKKIGNPRSRWLEMQFVWIWSWKVQDKWSRTELRASQRLELIFKVDTSHMA